MPKYKASSIVYGKYLTFKKTVGPVELSTGLHVCQVLQHAILSGPPFPETTWGRILREGSLFTEWGAAYYGNPYNSRESSYLHLIFTQHTIWPLRNLISFAPPFPNDASNFVRPPNNASKIFRPPPLTQKLKVPKGRFRI